MKKKISVKLRSQRGETIAETLVALLISALALFMLAGAISSASNMISRSNKSLDIYYSNNEVLTTQQGVPGDATTLTRTAVVQFALKENDNTVKLNGTGSGTVGVICVINSSLSGIPVIGYR